jgi:hypothetical protein
MTPSQALAQERARLRKEVVKMMKDELHNDYDGGYTNALVDVLALLRE